jgi:hypothetical protein
VERKIMVQTGPSTLIVVGILSQYGLDNIPHAVTYFSGKHSPAASNYEIYEQELLAIVQASKE